MRTSGGSVASHSLQPSELQVPVKDPSKQMAKRWFPWDIDLEPTHMYMYGLYTQIYTNMHMNTCTHARTPLQQFLRPLLLRFLSEEYR